MFTVRTPPLAVPTPPEIFLQVSQWQKDIETKPPSTSNWTPRHWQLPRMYRAYRYAFRRRADVALP
jgi:hypothetical protein